jgi:hypothetical protein
LAWVASGLPQGIGYGKRSADLVVVSQTVDPTPSSGLLEASPEPVNGALVAQAAPKEERPDEAVIAAADWFTRIGDTAARLMAMAPPDSQEPAVETVAASQDGGGSIASVESRAAAPLEGSVEQADFGAPLAVGVAAVMSFRYNHPLLRWIRS